MLEVWINSVLFVGMLSGIESISVGSELICDAYAIEEGG